ncbi:transcriptional corepressor LEUNIG isoform X2 [Medicago truncatula]|uniref:transcriptional corepressor LEUNIG isoform X2 n=1 Tax=Medicago truncatula TaxID=3880 RepID=UPI000D2F3C9F|nr:transcriptional corepressor LEUNIG isoform X2 [Medicago truncatula]
MSQSKYDEPDKALDAFIYDYLVKNQLYETARIFHDEGNVEQNIVMDAPGGSLFEWWSVFWELFMAKQGFSHSEPALSYLKAQEMRKQEEEIERIQFILQSPAQLQQYGAETQESVNGIVLCPINNAPMVRQNRVTPNTMATKLNEDRLASPLQGNALDDRTFKIMNAYTRGQLPMEDCAMLFNEITPITGGQPSGQTLASALSILQEKLRQDQNQNQQLPGFTQAMHSGMSAMMRSRAVVSEGSSYSVHHGSNQGGSDLTLKGWPLAGLDEHHAELLHKHNLILPSQSSNQFSPRQQLMFQAQQDLVNPFVSGFDGKRPSVLANNQNMVPWNDGQSNSVGGSIPNIVTPAQIGFPELPHLNLDMTHKASKSQVERKQKQKVGSCSGLANSSGTANTMGSSSGSSSTPTMQSRLPSWQQNGLGSLASTQNQLAHMDHLKSNGSLADNFESLSSLADADHNGRVDRGVSFNEMKHILASSDKVDCCHFSSDGKLFVTGGRDKKASLWCTKLFNLKSTLEEHTQRITDVRFSPSMFYVATSSADKTVKVWDVNNLGHSLRTFTGNTAVLSLDFHPSKHGLICSCDNKEIRFWNIANGSCIGIFKGGVTQVRFQPGLGKVLAAAVNNLILMFDTETLSCRFKLQGHMSLVRSVCWHSSGNYMASVCNDLVKLWAIGSDCRGACITQLNATESKFKTCVFHPSHNILIISCSESLMLWDYVESKKLIVPAHDKLVSALAVSDVTGLVASVSHDRTFKIWK